MKDKNVFNSKKYAAFFFTLTVLATIIILGIIYQPSISMWMGISVVTGLVCITAIGVGYIFNQRSLDKFLASVSSVAGAIAGKGDGTDAESDRNPVE
jgi:hypothetical protein